MKPLSNRLTALALPLGLLALGSATRAQEAQRGEDDPRLEGPRSAEAQLLVPVVFEGIVLGPDGAPAVGAVVVTSAGGKAVTDQDGAYRLEIQAPLEAESVQVTAVVTAAGGGSLTASTSVGLLASRLARIAPLVLTSSTTCQPSWLPTFGGMRGVSPLGVEAMAVFADGSGPALYMGGTFTAAGGVVANRVARWDGSNWSALGSGMNNTVMALAVWDDGSGPALYAGGTFTTAGGVAANLIARWNGSSWSALGSGISGTYVSSLAVHDAGSGPALYAGGSFTAAGGAAANRIARWNGSSWSALGSGLNGTVEALTTFDDGSGPALYVGGRFTIAGGMAANRIAKWNGATWSALGSGMSGGSTPYVFDLTVFDDGSGSKLYAGGNFITAGGVTVYRVARWNGSTWGALSATGLPGGVGLVGEVRALLVFDDGSGPALHAAGNFDISTSSIHKLARWTGSTWSKLGSGANDLVSALTVFDDGDGPLLYAGGSFIKAGTEELYGVAAWDGSVWSALGDGMLASITSQIVFDDGGGPALHACMRGSVYEYGIARWNGSTWFKLPGSRDADALAVFDDGSGPALYAANFWTQQVVRWNGSTWSSLGTFCDPWTGGCGDARVFALAVFDDGSGPALYAGGNFSTVGGVAANRIAKWNGSSWSALGSGMNQTVVLALTVFDDGSGPALYAGGNFSTAGGVSANLIAKWNGSTWSPLGSGMNSGSAVWTLVVFDDGSGPALYAGGSFTTAGGQPTNYIARWDGSAWSALGSGMNGSVRALAVFDDSSGPALYAGGAFTTAGGVAASNIAKWNGSSWSALGSGTLSPTVLSLAAFEDGNSPALFVGGSFSSAPDSGDSFLAEWGCDTTPPVLSCPTSVLVGDPFGSPGEIVTFEVTATDVHDSSPTVVCVPPSGSLFPRGTTLVNCTATDDAGNQSICQFPVIVQPKVHRPAKDPRGQ